MRLLTICLVSLLMGFSLSQANEEQQTQNKTTMLTDHDKEWKVIDSLESKQLPKSALEQVEVLYKKVRQEGDQAQIIKCIIYRNKFLIQVEDKDPSVAIVRLEKEVAGEANEVPKAVLNSMLAQLYFIYAQNNQYKIRNRTITVEEPTDIATWSIGSLIKKSNELYLQSIENDFQSTEILKDYKALLSTTNDKLNFESDLNSFLLQRVVEHFSNSRSLLTEPVNKFVMNDPKLLSSSEVFLELDIDSSDSLSYKYQALLTHQKLLKYLKSKNRTDELAYAELSRINSRA